MKSLKEGIENYSPANYSIVLFIPLVFLILGFLIWNVYLYSLTGNIENDLLRTLFVYAGFVFSVTSFILLLLILFFLKFIKKIFNLLVNKVSFLKLPVKFVWKSVLKIVVAIFVLIFFSTWLVFYSTYIFPLLPLVLGGGQPRALSLVADNQAISTLQSLGIPLAQGAANQTENLCVAFESGDKLVIIRSDRVLSINKNLIIGFGTLPGTRSVIEQECIRFAQNWIHKGFIFSGILTGTNFINLFRERIFKKPPLLFMIPSE